MHKEQPTELPPAFQPKTGILSTWQTSKSGTIPNATVGNRKRGPLSQTYLSFSFVPCSMTSEGWGVFGSRLSKGSSEDLLKEAVATLILE